MTSEVRCLIGDKTINPLQSCKIGFYLAVISSTGNNGEQIFHITIKYDKIGGPVQIIWRKLGFSNLFCLLFTFLVNLDVFLLVVLDVIRISRQL